MTAAVPASVGARDRAPPPRRLHDHPGVNVSEKPGSGPKPRPVGRTEGRTKVGGTGIGCTRIPYIWKGQPKRGLRVHASGTTGPGSLAMTGRTSLR